MTIQHVTVILVVVQNVYYGLMHLSKFLQFSHCILVLPHLCKTPPMHCTGIRRGFLVFCLTTDLQWKLVYLNPPPPHREFLE